MSDFYLIGNGSFIISQSGWQADFWPTKFHAAGIFFGNCTQMAHFSDIVLKMMMHGFFPGFFQVINGPFIFVNLFEKLVRKMKMFNLPPILELYLWSNI